MTPIQNNGGEKKRRRDARHAWQEPRTLNVIQTKGAEIENEKRAQAAALRDAIVRSGQPVPRELENKPRRREGARPMPRKRPRRRPMTVGEAIREELRDDIHGISSGIVVNAEDVVKVIVCTVLIILGAMLQTTFFAKFRPFGAVPDIMLALTAAIAVSEGEKWGSVCGLFCAFIIECLGGSGTGPSLLPLLYAPAGYICGILANYFLNNSVPVKAAYILGCGVGKMFITTVSAMTMLDATLPEILRRIVIPEFFSTAVAAVPVYFLVWLCLRPFHKSRAERTDQDLIQ